MQDFQACLSFALSIYVWVNSEICTVHKPDADTHLIKCGTPADSYPTAWGSYMEEEKPLGKEKRGGSANGKESSKNNKIKQLSLLASVPQLALKCPSLAACCHFSIVNVPSVLYCYDRSVNVDIISLHHGDSLSCRKPLISSTRAPVNAQGLKWMCSRTQQCWLLGHTALVWSNKC